MGEMTTLLMYRFQLASWFAAILVYIAILWFWPSTFSQCDIYTCTYMPTSTSDCYVIAVNGTVLAKCIICQNVTNGTLCYDNDHNFGANEWCPRNFKCPGEDSSHAMFIFAIIGAIVLLLRLMWILSWEPKSTQEMQSLLPANPTKSINPPWVTSSIQPSFNSVNSVDSVDV